MTNNKASNHLTLNGDPKKSEAQNYADLAVDPHINSAGVTQAYSNVGELNITATLLALKEKSAAVADGSLKNQEAMLASQAIALDAMFTSLALRAKANMGEYMSAAEIYLRLALKAQSQCRTTIETLAELKNPKPYIQNNSAQYQQVNNTEVRAGARTRENKNSANELLEDKADEQPWMDGSKTQEAGRTDQDMATVEV